jgi:DNA polymerase-1
MYKMLRALPGHKWVAADYSAAEARVYAVVAQDKVLLDAFARGLDIHSLNFASLIADSPGKLMEAYDYVIKSDKKKFFRLVAKVFCFACIYGITPQALYIHMVSQRNKATGDRLFPEITEKKVFEWFNRWHSTHPETREFQRSVRDEVKDSACERGGFVTETHGGRIRRFPGGPNKPDAPTNHKIQAVVGRMLVDAMADVDDAIGFRQWSPWSGPMLTIHDAIGLHVPDKHAEEAAHILQECMTTEFQGMPMPAEPAIGDVFAEVK